MGRKKVERWRHRAELVNQGATQTGAVCGLLLSVHIENRAVGRTPQSLYAKHWGKSIRIWSANQWFCRELVGFLWLHERPKINSPQIVGADIFDILHFMEFPAKLRIRTPLIRKGL